MSQSVSELLGSALAGDAQALERLLAACQDRLIGRIERKLPIALRTQLSPEDVLQETYLEVFRRFHTLQSREPAGFLRWLLTVADNRLIDCVRAAQAAKRGGGRQAVGVDSATSADGLLDLVWATSHTPSRSAAVHENARMVSEALEYLSPEYREAVRLRLLEGLSVAEVAARMNRTEFAVHKLCSRGLARLRQILGASGRFFSGA